MNKSVGSKEVKGEIGKKGKGMVGKEKRVREKVRRLTR